MEQPAAGVKSTTEIQQDMQQTRESITEKIAALEIQVLGTFQNAADTMTSTVDAVKEAVTSTPASVSESVKETVEAVKESFHETIDSLSVGGCVRKNPWMALGASAFAGVLLGYRTGRPNAPSNFSGQQHLATAPAPATAQQSHGFLSDLSDVVGDELRQLAEESLVGLIQSVKESIGSRMPAVVDTALDRVSDRLQSTSRAGAEASVNGC